MLIFFGTIVLQTNTVFAQDDDFEQISKIIEAGNAKELVKNFSASVELNINGEEATYSRSQAEAVLKDFFTKNPPKSFSINHKGASKGGLPYAIGAYEHSAGKYRVWIRLRKATTKHLVYEMSFIKE